MVEPFPAPLVILGLVILGLGEGALLTLLFNVLVSASPKHLAGDVGALRGTANNLSTAMGTALASAIDALRMANRVSKRELYAWSLATLDGEPAVGVWSAVQHQVDLGTRRSGVVGVAGERSSAGFLERQRPERRPVGYR